MPRVVPSFWSRDEIAEAWRMKLARCRWRGKNEVQNCDGRVGVCEEVRKRMTTATICATVVTALVLP